MRISDWSSDVCSSDLIGCGPGNGLQPSTMFLIAAANCAFLPIPRFGHGSEHSFQADAVNAKPGQDTSPSNLPALQALSGMKTERPPEIGIESCRESVCRDV